MKCLDTDLLVAILRGKKEAQKIVEELDIEGKTGTTSINAFEIYYGAEKSAKKNDNLKEATRLLERLAIFPLDLPSSRKAAEISAALSTKGETIDFRDAMIAAIAVENSLTLVTRNKSHFKRIRDLQVESW